MTLSKSLKGFSGVATMLAVSVAAVPITVTSIEAGPVIRDHRTPPKWQPNAGKNKKHNPTVRDHRTPPKWKPYVKPRNPYRPY